LTTIGAGWLRVKYESVKALDAITPPIIAVLRARRDKPNGLNTASLRFGFTTAG
jgi:hypothetical protein